MSTSYVFAPCPADLNQLVLRSINDEYLEQVYDDEVRDLMSRQQHVYTCPS